MITGIIIGIKVFLRMSTNNKSYIRPSVVINSMRDSGYKNTAYALAELIDNSIQAKADCVRLVCFEKIRDTGSRLITEIDEIAILDNGIGMNKDTLYTALEFGGSKNREDLEGMGKFGMGLPNSSVSQCLLTEIWSWVDGGDIYYTYLDVDKIKSAEVENIPAPIKKDLPEHLKLAYQGDLPKSGTVISWSKLDRLQWKTSRSIKSHTEQLIGRIYRRQLSKDSQYVADNHKLRIAFQTYKFDDRTTKYKSEVTDSFGPNDPLYLFSDTVLPEPLPGDLESVSPFTLHNKRIESVTLSDGTKSDVIIRTSILKPEVRDAIKATTAANIGSTIWGKHMKKNIGLSVVRAHRELDLIENFYISDNRNKDRWIGVEIEFEPVLDEYFGVTNNKQSATAIRFIPLTTLAGNAIAVDGLKDHEIETEYIKYLEEEGSPESKIILINQIIKDEMTDAYKALDGYDFKGFKTPDKPNNREDASTTDVINTVATDKERKADEGNFTEPEEPDVEGLVDKLKEEGMPEDEIDKIVKEIISNQLSVKFEFKELGWNDFFEVSTFQGLTLIRINTQHSFYRRFIEGATDEQKSLLFLCLAAWAKMEKEATENRRKMVANVRTAWGKMLEDYFNEDEE